MAVLHWYGSQPCVADELLHIAVPRLIFMDPGNYPYTLAQGSIPMAVGPGKQTLSRYCVEGLRAVRPFRSIQDSIITTEHRNLWCLWPPY